MERLLLLRILPRQGSLTTLRIVRDLERDLSFSEEEYVALKFANLDGGGVRWDESADPEKDVPVGPTALEIICEQLAEVERTGAQFPMAMLGVCDKVGYEGLPVEEKADDPPK